MKLPNNKILLLILVVLIAIFVVSRRFRSPSLESNLPDTVLSVDTSIVNEVIISPSVEKGEEVRLVKEDQNWQVKQNERRATADPVMVKSVLASLSKVKPDRITSRKKEKWSKYQVDSAGTHVVVRAGGKELADFWIGKASAASVYVRRDRDDDVYAVKGPLDGIFNKTYNEWRDKTFLQADVDSVSIITFTYPADSSFQLRKQAAGWMAGSVKADSAKVQSYLDKFRSRKLYTFVDEFEPSSDSDLTVSFGQPESTIETVRAWKRDDDQWILNSSHKPDVYVSASKNQVIDDLFVSRQFFVKE